LLVDHVPITSLLFVGPSAVFNALSFVTG